MSWRRLPGLYADYVRNLGKEACQELDDEGGLSTLAPPRADTFPGGVAAAEAAEAGQWNSQNDPTWEHRLRAAGLASERCGGTAGLQANARVGSALSGRWLCCSRRRGLGCKQS